MRKIWSLLLLCLLTGGILSAETISTKKDIAVFGLSYYDYSIPNGSLGMIDTEIKDVFVNLGRFNVIGMTYRLAENDVNEFISRIREYKESNVDIPEEVRLGKEVFTEADFNKLVGSFIVVIPSVSFYNLERDDEGNYDVELTTSFSFVDVSNLKTLGHFKVESSGSGEDSRDAVRSAVSGIPSRLTYEIRKMDVFQLKSGIIDNVGFDVMIEFGKNMGVQVGDEFTIVTPRVLSTGHQVSDETGLLLIKDVKEEVSIAQVIYSSGKPTVGDQVKEVARMGFDGALYASYIKGVDRYTGDDSSYLMLGLEGIASRGFFSFKPAFAVELPVNRIGALIASYFPVNFLLGCEIMNIYMGRLQIAPVVMGGISGYIPTNDKEEFYLSHGGANGKLRISYLLTRDMKFYVEGGYSFWMPLSVYAEGYHGVTIGGGITIKS